MKLLRLLGCRIEVSVVSGQHCAVDRFVSPYSSLQMDQTYRLSYSCGRVGRSLMRVAQTPGARCGQGSWVAHGDSPPDSHGAAPELYGAAWASGISQNQLATRLVTLGRRVTLTRRAIQVIRSADWRSAFSHVALGSSRCPPGEREQDQTGTNCDPQPASFGQPARGRSTEPMIHRFKPDASHPLSNVLTQPVALRW